MSTQITESGNRHGVAYLVDYSTKCAREVRENAPQESEFDKVRCRVIRRLNDYGIIDPMRLKRLHADFETESIWDLSHKITNHMFDERSGRRRVQKH